MEPIYQSNDSDRIIKYLMEKKLINSSIKCKKCYIDMLLKNRSDGDRKSWRCSKCQNFTAIRSGSWFSSSRLPISKLLKLIYNFTSNVSSTITASQYSVARSTVIDHFQRFR